MYIQYARGTKMEMAVHHLAKQPGCTLAIRFVSGSYFIYSYYVSLYCVDYCVD